MGCYDSRSTHVLCVVCRHDTWEKEAVGLSEMQLRWEEPGELMLGGDDMIHTIKIM